MQKNNVKNGINNINSVHNILENKRIGLITNHTGLDSELKNTANILKEKYNLVALFAPEHGIKGEQEAGVKIEAYIDEDTNIKVYSLYNTEKTITKEMLDLIDVLVFDIQDVGLRYYTYQYTLTNALIMCETYRKKCVVLDRVNLLGLKRVEGNILNINYSSFVGKFETPTRPALTIGEFARYINDIYDINADLEVCECINYTRDMSIEDTDIVFVPPSPNITSIDCVNIYVGTCLFEGTNMSEGRGTTKPFEQIGAPYLKNKLVIEKINELKLEGFLLRESYFTPLFSKHKDTLCKGIAIHITDKEKFKPFLLALHLIKIIRENHKEFEFLKPPKEGQKPFIDLLFGSEQIKEENFNIEKYIEEEEIKLKEFQEKSKRYWLYK
ncbi:MAG: exo-beta-N-acetylmuramidase NamZ domain-containing protein [Lachnospirales bacterium]